MFKSCLGGHNEILRTFFATLHTKVEWEDPSPPEDSESVSKAAPGYACVNFTEEGGCIADHCSCKDLTDTVQEVTDCTQCGSPLSSNNPGSEIDAKIVLCPKCLADHFKLVYAGDRYPDTSEDASSKVCLNPTCYRPIPKSINSGDPFCSDCRQQLNKRCCTSCGQELARREAPNSWGWCWNCQQDYAKVGGDNSTVWFTDHICEGCGATNFTPSHYLAGFCIDCEKLINVSQCTMCHELVTDVNERGRCAECDPPYGEQYLCAGRDHPHGFKDCMGPVDSLGEICAYCKLEINKTRALEPGDFR